jgi:uncharacterized protein
VRFGVQRGCEGSVIKDLEDNSKVVNDFGLTQDEFKILNDTIIHPLKEAGSTVWIFGSRATGHARPASDVDILFEFLPPSKKPPGFIFSIMSEFDESRFPYTVDLVDVENLATSYRDRVFKERILV